MYEVEVWIDVVCRGGNRSETVCTLFANHRMPIRPLMEETLSFHQAKGSNLEFKLVSPVGPARQTSVRVTIDEVSHYAVKSDGEVLFKTSLRCSEIPVVSEQDARVVCEFMTGQVGFEIDPYGVNKLAS